MIRRIAALAAAAVMAVVGAAAPAHADDEIGLSVDGVTWAQTLVTPLFDSELRWVPGDTDEASFYVRNGGPSAGEVTVDVTAADPDDLLAEDAFLVEARIAEGPWVPLDGGTTTLDPEALAIAQDADSRVDVRATFRPESTREDQTVTLSVRVQMEGDDEVGGVDDGNDGDVGGNAGGSVGGIGDLLPDTGSPFGMGLIWAAAGLIGAGLALLRPRRSREEVPARG